MRRNVLGLYVLTPPCVRGGDISLIRAILATGSVSFFQIRLKGERCLDERALWKVLRPLAKASKTRLLFNDALPDGLASWEADGVHVGQNDLPASLIRRRVGGRGLLGVSCHDSIVLAHRAVRDGADYVSFGSFFPSGTREDASSCDVSVLRAWRRTKGLAPALAIGGITLPRAKALIYAGADGIAICGGIWKASNPLATVLHLASMMR